MNKIKIGVIVSTHGLKGEVCVKSLSDFDELRYQKGNTIYLDHDGMQPLIIDSVRVHKDKLLLSFEGYHDINLVEKWRHGVLYIDKEKLQELDEDEIYYFELRDMRVYDENHEYLGDVKELIETGANLVLRVSDGENEFLLPYVKAFVKETNREEKKLIVQLVEGLR